jgi:hypothetical protein
MASADGTLRTFETASGRETFRIMLQRPVIALAFEEPGGALIATSVTRTLAGASGITLKRYLPRRDDLIFDACSRVTRELSDQEWRQYVGADVPPQATCGDRRR